MSLTRRLLLTLVAVLAVHPAWSAIAFVQKAQAHCASATTCSVALSGVASGDFVDIYVISNAESQTLSSIADSNGTLSTPVYIKLFNAAAASVTLGTTSATLNLMCPGSAAGFVQNFTWPPGFGTALVYAVTGGIALNDDTSITASSVIVNITYY